MESIDTLADFGLSLPTPAYLAGALVFGMIGLIACYSGKRRHHPPMRWLGIALMLYPYAIQDTRALFAIGLALTVAVWWVAR